MDKAHIETDKILAEIERKLRKEYRQATKETEEKLNKYFKAFERKDAAKREQVKNGEISSNDYKKWRVSQLAVGKRWEDMRDALAQDMANTNIIARSIADGYMPQVYAENHNFATYQIEKGARIDTSYTLYDAQSVERLIRENPDILPKPGRTTQELIDSGVLQKWDKRVIQSTMIQGILQGESIPKLAKRMAHDLGEKEYKSVVRHARTMTTATQNAGRVDGFKRAKGMGIDVKQTWVATLDGRTRHEHRVLDGQTREVGEYFEAEGYKIRYPGDPEAAYAMIMNCRCTLIGQIKGFERDTTAYRHDPDLGDMTYEEWKNGKKDEEQFVIPDYIKKAVSIEQASEDWFEYEIANMMSEYIKTGTMPNEDMYGNPVDKETRQRYAAEAEKIQEIGESTKTEYKTLYRGLVMDEGDIRALTPGEQYTFDTITATATDKKVASIYSDVDNSYIENGVPVIIEIQKPDGIYGFDRDGTEVVIPKGSEFKIERNWMDDNGVVHLSLYAPKKKKNVKGD